MIRWLWRWRSTWCPGKILLTTRCTAAKRPWRISTARLIIGLLRGTPSGGQDMTWGPGRLPLSPVSRLQHAKNLEQLRLQMVAVTAAANARQGVPPPVLQVQPFIVAPQAPTAAVVAPQPEPHIVVDIESDDSFTSAAEEHECNTPPPSPLQIVPRVSQRILNQRPPPSPPLPRRSKRVLNRDDAK